MPIYEYLCDACGERVERIQKIADPPLKLCPACGEEALRRLVSAPAFQFKGSGWYVTDYARKGKGAEGSSGSTESAAAAPKTESAGGAGSGAKESGSASETAKPKKAPSES
ncbi:MAG: FmdB family zinc ribbon protein [Thermoanaerobaculia bacterium]